MSSYLEFLKSVAKLYRIHTYTNRGVSYILSFVGCQRFCPTILDIDLRKMKPRIWQKIYKKTVAVVINIKYKNRLSYVCNIFFKRLNCPANWAICLLGVYTTAPDIFAPVHISVSVRGPIPSISCCALGIYQLGRFYVVAACYNCFCARLQRRFQILLNSP